MLALPECRLRAPGIGVPADSAWIDDPEER
jgi:hypothetical protein